MKTRQQYIQKAKAAFRVATFIRPYGSRLAVIFIFLVSGTCFGLVGPYMSKLFIDVVFKADPSTGKFLHAGMLFIAVGIMFCAQSAQQLAQVLRTRYAAKLGNTMLYDLRKLLYEKLLGLSLSYFNRQQTGGLVARVNQDTAELQRFFVDFFPTVLESLLLLLGAGTFLFMFNGYLTAVAILPIVVGVFFLKKRYLLLSRFYREYFELRSRLSAHVGDTVSGIRMVKAFGQEPREIANFDAKSGVYRDAGIGLSLRTSFYFQAFSFFIILASSAVWMTGGEFVLMKKMTLGSVVAFLGYLALIYRPVISMGNLLGSVAGSLSAAQRIFDVIDARPELVEAPDCRRLSIMTGTIEFTDVSFAYETRPVVCSCNFTIEAGQWVAFVGASGAGKSSIANIICRLFDVTTGTVFIDGRDVRTVSIADLRRNIGLVPQETFLFDGTIFDNIAYGKPGANMEEVVEASKHAFAHDFIMAKPESYDTLVGERGVFLSGGEKQRIAIARALVINPSVLIFDEATSAVDPHTENAILSAIKRDPRKRTFICIAHRLPSPERFDRLFVVENGSIVESGTHTELLANKNAYYNLVMRTDQHA
jgi:ATP-binding cassette, subfamily B, bacterial